MNKKTHVMHITYDMRIGGTEMVIKNIIDGLVGRNSFRQNHANKTTNTENTQTCRTEVRPTESQDSTHLNLSQESAPNVGRNSFLQTESQFKMSVLCIESPLGPFAEELQKNDIEFFQLNRQPGFDTNLIKQIRQTIKSNKVDIIHCHQYTPWVYGVIAAAFTQTKVIFTEHGRFYPDSSTWKRKLINPILNLFTDQVTAISKATKQALVEFENIPEKYIDVIYNGIAPLEIEQTEVEELRKELAISEDHTILGTIARFDPIKNHTMMLKAFSQTLKQQPNTTLIMVGDGEERANIEASIEELNITKSVILTGYQSKPKNYLALMDIYLLSSFSEGTSMTLLEAMSLGKPCVVTDVGGNLEVIIDGENGFVTPNDNAVQFSNAMIKMINKPELISTMANKAYARFGQKFVSTNMIHRYRRIYGDI